MNPQKHAQLKPYHAFKVEAKADSFYHIDSIEQLKSLISKQAYDIANTYILGGGFNTLFYKDFQGSVLYNELKGMHTVLEDDDYTVIKVASGEDWQTVVNWSVENNLGGIENLTHIPGTVGAAPIQNIGAYGVEVCQSIVEVETISLNNGQLKVYSKDECRFEYRDSIFKQELKNKVFITAVTFKFQKSPQLCSQYKDVANALNKKQLSLESLTVVDMQQTIAEIRVNKLPDPSQVPNAGSFFKNPIYHKEFVEKLLKKYPNMPHYTVDKFHSKLSAGWLIDSCGFKGYQHNGAAVHKNHALVLINKAAATGNDVIELAEKIKIKVLDKFNVELVSEVNCL